jgi:chitinase
MMFGEVGLDQYNANRGVTDHLTASATPGPNAPLRDGCHNSTQPDASASASIAAWTKAGLRADQITLGLPSYGYIQTSSARRLIQRGRGARWGRLGVRQDDDGDDDGTAETAEDGTVEAADLGVVRVKGEGDGDDSGQVQFKQLISEGAIKLSGNGDYVGAGGFSRMWDVCSSTVRLFLFQCCEEWKLTDGCSHTWYRQKLGKSSLMTIHNHLG